MANEVSHRHSATGDTLYFTIRNTARQMWNTAGTPNFETLTVANWGNYDVAMTESPASSYFYVGTFPAISGNMVAGWYWVDVFKRAGGSPAISDVMQASYFGYWDGTTFKWWGVDDLQFAGQTITCSGGVTIPAATLASTTNITSASGITVATNSDKTGYSLTATTGLGNQTANITGNLSGSVGSVTGAVGSVTGAVGSVTAGVTVTTNNDKTGYSLTATTGLGNQTANITGNLSGSVGSVTGAVGSVTGAVGSVTGSVGSISGVTFPTNFSSLNITATTGLVRPDMANASGNYAGTVATVTTLTNLPAITSNWLTAAGIDSTAGAEIADAVWDEALAGHAGAGTAGAALSTASTGGVDAGTLADAVWDELLNSGHSTANSAGKILYDNLNAPVATVDTVVDGIATTLGSAGAGLTAVPWNAAWDAEVQSECTDALNAYDPPTNTEMEARTLVAASYATPTNITAASGVSLAAAGLDAVVVETGLNARQALSVASSAAAGVLAGAATTTVTIAAAGVPATNRITATVDADGNRSAVTLSLPT